MADVATAGGGHIVDCWRTIGVRGDGSCERLATYIHCRNCPSHAAAATALLDQLPTGTEAYADTVARAGSHADAGPSMSCAIFRVGDEWLALPTQALSEVCPMAPIRSLPHQRSAAVIGLAAVRGSLLVCVSLRALLGLSAGDGSGPDDGTRRGPVGGPGGGSDRAFDGEGTAADGRRLLVLGSGRNAIALPVDEVSAVDRVPAAALLAPPASVARADRHVSTAVFVRRGHHIGLLDAPLLHQAIAEALA